VVVPVTVLGEADAAVTSVGEVAATVAVAVPVTEPDATVTVSVPWVVAEL
jgi:hypothetical protein